MFKFKRSVASIMKSFTLMVDQLDEVIQYNQHVVADNSTIIQTLQEDTLSCMAEIKQADSIKAKLKDILS